MGQIPTSEETYKRLSFFRTTGMRERLGAGFKSTTWDDIMSAMADVCNKHMDEFVSIIRTKKGKNARTKN
jgi:hypothetical protein